MRSSSPNLTVVTNIPTPYRLEFFEQVGLLLSKRGGGLTVFACAETEPGRHWPVPTTPRNFELRILRGIHPYLADVAWHWNPGISAAVATSSPRWILVAGAWLTPTMVQAMLTRNRSVPAIFWSEGHDAAVRHHRGFVARIRSRALQMYDGFAVPNERSAEFVRAHVRSDVPVLRLPNCVSEGTYSPHKESRKEARRLLGLSERRTILVPGTLSERKGTDEILAAWATLQNEVRDTLSLIFVGTGPLMPLVQEAARLDRSILAVGHRGSLDVANHFRAADGVLMASRYDPNPLSMIEAARSGCVLMATEAVGNSRDLIEVRNGRVMCDTSAKEIGASITWFASLTTDQLLVAQEVSLHRGSAFGCKAVARDFLDGLEAHF